MSMEKSMKNLTINEELRSVQPPLSKYEGLEASIIKEGCTSGGTRE